MEDETETVHWRHPNGDRVPLCRRGGVWLCPVCGEELPFAPYDPATGEPSRRWCPGCDCQFGWDDHTPPAGVEGVQQARWAELRRRAGPPR